MSALAETLLLWAAIAIPLGIVVGRVIRFGDDCDIRFPSSID